MLNLIQKYTVFFAKALACFLKTSDARGADAEKAALGNPSESLQATYGDGECYINLAIDFGEEKYNVIEKDESGKLIEHGTFLPIEDAVTIFLDISEERKAVMEVANPTISYYNGRKCFIEVICSSPEPSLN